MAMNPVDAEGQTIRLSSLDPRPKAAPKSAPADKPLDGPTTKTEVQRALCVCYNLIHKIVHDDYRYQPGDFAEEADGIVELMQQHAVLRIIMRVAAPVAAFGAIYEKVEGTVTRFRERAEDAKRRKAAAKLQPVGENGQATPTASGLSAEQIAKRPFAR